MTQLPERDLPPGRHLLLKEHLMTEIRQAQAQAPAPTPEQAPAPSRKWLRPALAAAAVATAAAVAFTVLPSAGSGEGAPQPPSRQTVALLEDMALAAASGQPHGPVRDDQFVYVESRVSYSSARDGRITVQPLHRQEIWTSVDGLHTGLKREAGEKPMDLPPDVRPGGPGWEVSAFYNHLKTLPTTADRMWDYLYETAPKYSEQDTYQAMFVLAGDLLVNSVMPPEQGAALFRAVARIPGVTLTGDAVDAAGRPGAGVSRQDPDNPTRDEWIFDLRTHAFLGERSVATSDHSDVKKGTVTSNTAVLRRAIVDRAGQRP
ncbi:CU044_5270 family protein [Streptomyces niveiscabiei]|uniref:CU044_5270 family protein n=1 Tax=Streptomyces niveiscabiei TaxID=164115 RepID=UPI0006EB8F23|nr:CU044_5270 family protein [Streptomyces niveiscabiei]